MSTFSESIASYITPEIMAKLEAQAKLERRSQAAIIRIALEAYLSQAYEKAQINASDQNG